VSILFFAFIFRCQSIEPFLRPVSVGNFSLSRLFTLLFFSVSSGATAFGTCSVIHLHLFSLNGALERSSTLAEKGLLWGGASLVLFLFNSFGRSVLFL